MFILTLTDEDSVVLDSVEVTREDLEQARHNGVLAQAILYQLSVGTTVTARLFDRLWLFAAVLAVHIFERTHRSIAVSTTE